MSVVSTGMSMEAYALDREWDFWWQDLTKGQISQVLGS